MIPASVGTIGHHNRGDPCLLHEIETRLTPRFLQLSLRIEGDGVAVDEQSVWLELEALQETCIADFGGEGHAV